MNSMRQEQFYKGRWPLTRLWRTFVTGNSEELTVIFQQWVTKLLDILLTKESVLLFTAVDFLYSEI